MGNNLTTITPLPEGLAESLDRRFLELCMFKRPVRHKFGATSVESDGIKFPSKLEERCYQVLKTMKNSGRIRMFLRQPSFDLPGGSKHKVDYCLFTEDHVLFVEAKGRDLPMGKLKRKQVEDLYQIDIHVVKDAREIEMVIRTHG
jgi:hypothetical protein